MHTQRYQTSLGEIVFQPARMNVFSLASMGGLYMFCGENSGLLSGTFTTVYYIGQTNDLTERLSNHERWQEAADLGATDVLIAPIGIQSHRDIIERELISRINPALNEKFRTQGLLSSYMRA
jgi:hypothetical protein